MASPGFGVSAEAELDPLGRGPQDERAEREGSRKRPVTVREEAKGRRKVLWMSQHKGRRCGTRSHASVFCSDTLQKPNQSLGFYIPIQKQEKKDKMCPFV